MVRNTFKSPLMMAFYTLLVLSACFHGFNGLDLHDLVGRDLTEHSQKIWLKVCQA